MSIGNEQQRNAINAAIELVNDESATENERKLAAAIKAIVDAQVSAALHSEMHSTRENALRQMGH